MTPRWLHLRPGSHHPAWVVLPQPPLRLDCAPHPTIWYDPPARRLWARIGAQVAGLQCAAPEAVGVRGPDLVLRLADGETLRVGPEHLHLRPPSTAPPELPLGARRAATVQHLTGGAVWADLGWVYRLMSGPSPGPPHDAQCRAIGLAPPGATLSAGEDGGVLLRAGSVASVAPPAGSLRPVRAALPAGQAHRAVMVPGHALVIGPAGRHEIELRTGSVRYVAACATPWQALGHHLYLPQPSGLLRVDLRSGELHKDSTLGGPAVVTRAGVVRVHSDRLRWPDGATTRIPPAHRSWPVDAETVGVETLGGERWRCTARGSRRAPDLASPPQLGTPAPPAWARQGFTRAVGEGLGGVWMLARHGGLGWVPGG